MASMQTSSHFTGHIKYILRVQNLNASGVALVVHSSKKSVSFFRVSFFRVKWIQIRTRSTMRNSGSLSLVGTDCHNFWSGSSEATDWRSASHVLFVTTKSNKTTSINFSLLDHFRTCTLGHALKGMKQKRICFPSFPKGVYIRFSHLYLYLFLCEFPLLRGSLALMQTLGALQKLLEPSTSLQHGYF
jgi:hypothetical protein